MALILAMSRSKLVRVDDIMYNSTANGASFCHVDRYRDVIHGRAVMVEGYQKCSGAAPILRRRADSSIISIVLE